MGRAGTIYFDKSSIETPTSNLPHVMKTKLLQLSLAICLVALPASGEFTQKLNDSISCGGDSSSASIGGETFFITSTIGDRIAVPALEDSLVVESGFIATLSWEQPVEPSDDSGNQNGIADIWEDRYGITSFVPTNDVDHDGMNDLLEAAFNLDPGKSDASKAFKQSVVKFAGQKYLQLIYRRNRWHSGIVLLPCRNSDLNPLGWTESGISEISVIELDDETDEVTARSDIPISSRSRQFMRLKATYTSPTP